jgi:hypothetical protein
VIAYIFVEKKLLEAPDNEYPDHLKVKATISSRYPPSFIDASGGKYINNNKRSAMMKR